MRVGMLFVLCVGLAVGCGEKPAPEAETPTPATEKSDGALVKAPKGEPAIPMPVSYRVNASNIEVIAVKNGDAEVKGVFKEVSGKLGFGGTKDAPTLSGTVEVTLGSYDSGLELRDERVHDLFFEVAQYAKAVLKLKNSGPVPSPRLPMGELTEVPMTGTLSMHGAEVPIETTLVLRRTSPVDLEVKTKEALTLSIAEFGMNGPLQALIKACAHQSVSDKVVVNTTVGFSGAPTEGLKVPPPPRSEMFKRKAKVKVKRVQ